MKISVQSAIAAFGAAAKQKLANVAASGQPEDQLRAPFEQLLADMAELAKIPRGKVSAVGESSLSDLKTRPDYAITVFDALAGFVELKAPAKGADPRKFKDLHDKAQWEKLRSLPNVVYTDGNACSLWQNGELTGAVIRLIGDIETSGDQLENVPPSVWRYEVSGKQVLVQWFSYRRKNRDRPIIGDRRPPSPLGQIQPDHWLAEYTTELINVLNILGWLSELEPKQAYRGRIKVGRGLEIGDGFQTKIAVRGYARPFPSDRRLSRAICSG